MHSDYSHWNCGQKDLSLIISGTENNTVPLYSVHSSPWGYKGQDPGHQFDQVTGRVTLVSSWFPQLIKPSSTNHQGRVEFQTIGTKSRVLKKLLWREKVTSPLVRQRLLTVRLQFWTGFSHTYLVLRLPFLSIKWGKADRIETHYFYILHRSKICVCWTAKPLLTQPLSAATLSRHATLTISPFCLCRSNFLHLEISSVFLHRANLQVSARMPIL